MQQPIYAVTQNFLTDSCSVQFAAQLYSAPSCVRSFSLTHIQRRLQFWSYASNFQIQYQFSHELSVIISYITNNRLFRS